MARFHSLNPLAERVRNLLMQEYPEWSQHVGMQDQNDLEIAVPAPPGSKAGHLVIFTTEGKDLWLRFSPPYMCYPLDDLAELVSVVRSLVEERVCMVAITQGDTWTETTLLPSGEHPALNSGQSAQVISWRGNHDKTLSR